MTRKPRKSEPPIMVAVDFSAPSAAALRWGACQAERFGQPLIVVHVVHDPGSAPGYYHQVKKAKRQLHRIEEAAQQMMDDFMEQARTKHPDLAALESANRVLVVGLPVNRILEVAEKRGASQIVMGSQGRTGLSGMLLGSKALKVAQLAPMTVTIVKHGVGE